MLLGPNVFNTIAGVYGVSSGSETQVAYSGIESAVSEAMSFLSNSNDAIPRAYIRCLVFDNGYNDITPSGAGQQVSAAAEGWADTAEKLSKEIEITEDGYIYIMPARRSIAVRLKS